MKRCFRRLALVLLFAFFCTAPAAAYEFHPQGWAKPLLYGAERYATEMLDFDPEVPGNETMVERFAVPGGGRVYRYSHNGRIFSYEVDHNGIDPMDYEIVDFDGSGAFEIKQSAFNAYPLPRWTFMAYRAPTVGADKRRTDLTSRPPSRDDLIAALSPLDTLATGDEASAPRVALKVNFEFDSDELTTFARSVLDEVGKALTSDRLKNLKFRIEGHTDSRGGFEYNKELSLRRARAVQQYLTTRFDLDPERLEVEGKGETEPLKNTDPEDGVNRRVEIVNLGASGSGK